MLNLFTPLYSSTFQNGSSHLFSSVVFRRVRSTIIIMKRRTRTTAALQGPPLQTKPNSTAAESLWVITPSPFCKPSLTTPPRTTLWRSYTGKDYNLYVSSFSIFYYTAHSLRFHCQIVYQNRYCIIWDVFWWLMLDSFLFAAGLFMPNRAVL